MSESVSRMSVMKICQPWLVVFEGDVWKTLVMILVSTEVPLLSTVNHTDPATGLVNLNVMNLREKIVKVG